MNINIIINEDEKSFSILYNGYNIIKNTFYDEEKTTKILNILKDAINEEYYNADFKDFKTFLQYK